MSSEEAAVVAVVVVVRHGGTDFAEAEDDTHATRDLWTEVAKATRERERKCWRRAFEWCEGPTGSGRIKVNGLNDFSDVVVSLVLLLLLAPTK